MSNSKEMTCIICPNSCRLAVTYEAGKVIKVIDAQCKKGIEYAENEILHPMRSLTTTVRVKNGVLPLVSVRSDRPIAKEMIPKVVAFLRKLEVEAPVKYHQIISEDIFKTGTNIIATREIQKLI